MRRSFLYSLLMILSLLFALTGCGGGNDDNNTGNIGVTVNPGEVRLTPGGTQQFTATVSGNNNAQVTWSLETPKGDGSITANGLYTAPTAVGIYYVVATSQADPTKTGRAKVNVVTEDGVGGTENYTGTITINRTGYGSGTTYDESATINHFQLTDGGNGQWGLVIGSPTSVTAHVADRMDTGAHVDYALNTVISRKTTIYLSIKSNTYDLLIVTYAENATVTGHDGNVTTQDWPIAVTPIRNQPLPADNSRITGSITDTTIASCTVTWDLRKSVVIEQ